MTTIVAYEGARRPGGYAGALKTVDRVVVLLYILMRDHIPPGKLEVVMSEIENAFAKSHVFSNDFLAAYAFELKERLDGATPLEALREAHRYVGRAEA